MLAFLLGFVIVALISFLNLVIYLDWDYKVTIFFSWFRKRPKWFSTIPGQPLHVDYLYTSFFGPWPEPNDFNVTLPTLRAPVILEGPACESRFWSFTIYPRNFKMGDNKDHTKSLPYLSSKDMKIVDGWFKVAISPTRVDGCDWINTSELTTNVYAISMRNYCVKSGRSVCLPKVTEISSGEVLVPHQVVTAGAHSSSQSKVTSFQRFMRVFALHLFVLYFASLFTSCCTLCTFSVLSGFLAFFYYILARFLFARKMRKVIHENVFENKPQHEYVNSLIKLPSKGQGFGPGHIYQCFAYDAMDQDVEVTAQLPGSSAVYTSIICYDDYAVPLNEFLFDETIKADEAEKDKSDFRSYHVYLTRHPTYLPQRNEIDVSSVPRGFCIVRLLYPTDNSVIEECKPSVRPVPRSAEAKKQK